MNNDDMRMIREMYNTECGCCGQRIGARALAKRYNVSRAVILDIVHRKDIS